MRQSIEQNKKADRPGIRTGVWLTVFGLVLVCLLTISFPKCRATTETSLEDMADQDSVIQPHGSVQRTSHIKFTPKVSDSGSDYDNEEALLTVVEQLTQDRRTWMDNPKSDR